MQGKLKRAPDGNPLEGTDALSDYIDQLYAQAKALETRAMLLESLLAELSGLSPKAQAALHYLITEKTK